MTLRSHPDKTLKTHVAEVREAAHKIWFRHSSALTDQLPELFKWLNWAVTMHDVGKGCSAFQSYIGDVKGFKGRRRLKAHTPMSVVTALTHGKQHDWDWRQTLAVAACAAGHHSNFKSHDELQHLLSSTEGQDILVGQLDDFDWQSVAEAVSDPDSDCDTGLVAGFENDYDLDEIAEWFEEDLIECSLHRLDLAEAIAFRLHCQFVHSILLEADKAYLIIPPEERNTFRHAAHRTIQPSVVLDYIRKNKRSSRLDSLRTEVRRQLTLGMENGYSHPVHTMTLPTGSGKTLLAATWAVQQRAAFQTKDHMPPVIIVLPFLSIIEQTQNVYRSMLGERSGLLSYHSLSVREHQDAEDAETAEFFLDTWHGDVIITTFDQFLFALLESRTKHQMRFHQLCDALIVMDEIQALPCKLWDIVAKSVTQLVSIGNCRLLAMSATQTGFLANAFELIPNPTEIFATVDRYEIVLNHDIPMLIGEFINELIARAPAWNRERVLIVLNTRKSAKRARDALADKGFAVEFLTADVTPRDRLDAIERIKKGKPCIVVSTQCIEAGVDIDMSRVIRDFAPLDSLIQVAGRCNRNADRPRETVEIVNLLSENAKPFAGLVYDPVLLQETRRVLKEHFATPEGGKIPEERIFSLTKAYFKTLNAKTNVGHMHTKQFARWEKMPSIRELLRGKQDNQVSFVVIEQDPALEVELKSIAAMKDRWERRRAVRQLSARIAAITVSVFVKDDFRPDRFADRDSTGNFWLLHGGHYDPHRGIDFFNDTPTDDEEDSWGTII